MRWVFAVYTDFRTRITESLWYWKIIKNNKILRQVLLFEKSVFFSMTSKQIWGRSLAMDIRINDILREWKLQWIQKYDRHVGLYPILLTCDPEENKYYNSGFSGGRSFNCLLYFYKNGIHLSFSHCVLSLPALCLTLPWKNRSEEKLINILKCNKLWLRAEGMITA